MMTERLSPGAKAAILTLLVGALCLALSPTLPWLVKWPAGLTLPVADWISGVIAWLVDFLKPLARWISGLLAWPMAGAGWLFVQTPYPLTIGLVTALGWHLGGWKMAVSALLGLGFVLFSGYWNPGMTTLSLVAISVPLALITGSGLGLLAWTRPQLRRPVQTLLDVMQTVPTFAYLLPLIALMGFGPVVGLIASAIYAAPPMARNVLLGLERIDPEIREAAVMNGADPWQKLFLIEIPAASRQIMVGINQTIMAALSMVIIAAVIGGFNDIGWAVLLTMRKADFGNSVVAGMVIVVFAMLIDRMSASLAEHRRARSHKVALTLALCGLVVALLPALPVAQDVTTLRPLAGWLNETLGNFTRSWGGLLDQIKNNAMLFGLLPAKLGLGTIATPQTWGFLWSPMHSLVYFTALALVAGLFAWRGRLSFGLSLLIAGGILKVGIINMPWPFVLTGVGGLAFVAGGWRLALYAVMMLTAILLMGLWQMSLLSLYLSGTAVVACILFGGALGTLGAMSPAAWTILRPICDLLQTIPLFVFLIPVLMFFKIGEFSAFLAICAYAVVPMIRYTREGLVSTPDDLVEAAVANGATKRAILTELRAPWAAPTILLGLNQSILYAFSMLVIAALIGTTDLGQQIYLALGQGDVGLGLTAGAAMAILALVSDRLVQAFAERQRKALGL